jgi:uncharacterized repeat protein (TIGR03987 family)
MNPILLAVFMITLALILYTLAVGLNWRAKRLTVPHLIVFWCAVASDAFATNEMRATLPVIIWDMHTIVGYASLALMAVLSLYGSVALWQKREDRLTSFHRIAVPVWLIWVASYASGIWLGMHRGG